MPIPVTCPECQFHFRVGDEFAGRPGRCPECAAIIDVPGSEPSLQPLPPDEHLDPYPYRTPRAVEAFEDFPSRHRRRDAEHADQEREDYEDRPRGPRTNTFDPHARAAAWARVYKGLGYMQIAVILYFFGQLLQTGFFLAHGAGRGNGNALPDSGELAVALGGAVVSLASGVFWILGLLGGTKVPYVPARGWARAGYLMGITGVGAMIACFCGFFTALAMIGQQGPNGGAAALVLLAFLAMCLGVFLLVAAEICSLVSLAKIGDGLRAASGGSWARQSIVLLLMLIGLLCVGMCGFFVYVAEKQKQKGPQDPAPDIQNKAGNPKGKNKAPIPPKGKDVAKDQEVVKENDKDGPANGQVQQQPNPFDDGTVDEKTFFVFEAVAIGLILLYLLHFSIMLQKSRRAIRDEMHRLVGPNETEHDRY
jgi:hypothetical protein